ncbi:MAG: hypothetical protein M0P31_04670 [Solirubrobacteraceae bacterium]|nr:hypothetical protein [Solirubrobacteraceae bacterium]
MDLAEHVRRNIHKAPKAMRMLGHTAYPGSETSQTPTAPSTTPTERRSGSRSTNDRHSKASSTRS